MVQNIAAILVVPATTAVGKAAGTVVTAHNAAIRKRVVIRLKPGNVPLPQARSWSGN
jgi:hypothetical protein